jgi:hypothetical protein
LYRRGIDRGIDLAGNSDTLRLSTVRKSDIALSRSGKIDHFMIDMAWGRVLYAVVDFCGFMCLHPGHRPLPWTSLKYDSDRLGYVTDVSQDQIERKGRGEISNGDRFTNQVQRRWRCTWFVNLSQSSEN